MYMYMYTCEWIIRRKLIINETTIVCLKCATLKIHNLLFLLFYHTQSTTHIALSCTPIHTGLQHVNQEVKEDSQTHTLSWTVWTFLPPWSCWALSTTVKPGVIWEPECYSDCSIVTFWYRLYIHLLHGLYPQLSSSLIQRPQLENSLSESQEKSV